MSQHDNDKADGPICGGSSQAASIGSPAMRGGGAIIGKAVATNIPEATGKEEQRTESALSKRLRGEARSPSPI